MILTTILSGITTAVADVGIIGAGALLVLTGIFVGRSLERPVKTSNRYGSRSHSYIGSDGKKVDRATFEKQISNFHRNFDNKGFIQSQKRASTGYKKRYYKKPYKKPVANITSRYSVLKKYKSHSSVNPNSGPHSKRLAAFEAKQQRSRNDFDKWSKTSANTGPAIRKMTEQEKRDWGLS